jgi:hypothetical protein
MLDGCPHGWHHGRMPNEPAAATTRGTILSNRARLIGASANRRWALGIEANAARAKKRHVDLEPVIRAIRGDGKVLLRQIAAELNKRRVPAARGGLWSPAQVSRVLSGIDAL